MDKETYIKSFDSLKGIISYSLYVLDYGSTSNTDCIYILLWT